jgi:hypothetical protein
MTSFLLLAAATALLTLVLARALQARLQRRVRPEHAATRVVDMATVQRALRVRGAAEAAALRVALGLEPAAENPFEAGTRDAVLWTTSYHARLMELETEAFAPAPAVARAA